MDAAFSRNLRVCLDRIGSNLTTLLGEDFVLARRDAVVGRDAAMKKFGTGKVVASFTKRLDPDGSPAGFVLLEKTAIHLAATMIMLPSADSLTGEVAAGYAEIMNMVIGAWKAAAEDDDHRLSNQNADRSQAQMSSDAFADMLEEKDYELVAIPGTFEGKSILFGILGPSSWIGVEKPVAAAPPAAPVSAPAAPVSPASAPGAVSSAPFGRAGASVGSLLGGSAPRAGHALGTTRSGTATSGSAHGSAGASGAALAPAAVMIVDMTGELRAFLAAKLASKEWVATYPSPDRREIEEGGALVILGPDPALFRALEAAQVVVTRLGPKAPEAAG
ncbi:MAG: hypothetical protein IV100_20345 [Myxococcales bacterium]|nr:hypothetical protein [Myxococcales bacterium]